MKRYFLVDIENVGSSALSATDRESLKKITTEDFFVLCSNRLHGNGTVPSELDATLTAAGASFRIIEIGNVGKNAMDFCLASQLGYLIAEEGKGAEYWIVSNDRGFESCIEFGKAFGVKVGLTPSFSVCEQRKASQVEEREILKSLLPEYSPKAIALTQKCLVAAKSKEDYHNRLQKALYESQTRDVYLKTKHMVMAN